MAAEIVLAWHWIAADRRLRHGRRRIVEVGGTYRCRGPLVICSNGMHASIQPRDALQYATSGLVSRVELGGEIVHGHDKLCARWRRVLWIADATTTLHEFACWCAEQALLRERELGREPDARSWASIAAKRAWLRGEIGDAELAAARAAAGAEQNAELERLLLALAPAGREVARA